MNILSKHIDLLKSLPKESPGFDERWLPKDPNNAFIICIGSGPWKTKRREQVQQKVLDWFASKEVSDFSEISLIDVPNIFPFKWQNQMLFNLITNLKSEEQNFKKLCSFWRLTRETENWREAIKNFFEYTDTPKGSKVLWLFVRDYLKLPAFPIDRHVSRNLKKLGFPENSWYMVEACLLAERNPNTLNRSFFLSRNPEYS